MKDEIRRDFERVSPEIAARASAFTVEVRAGDNLMIHAAISMARPGDVIIH